VEAVMRSVLEMLEGPTGSRIAAVLVHSLWQAMAIALLVGLCLRGTAARRTTLRYGVALGGLAMTVLAAMVTWSVVGLATGEVLSPEATSVVGAAPLDAHSVSTEPAAVSVKERVTPRTGVSSTNGGAGWSWAAPLFVGVWLLGVLVMLVRTVLSVIGARKLLRSEEVVDAAFLNLVERVRQTMGLWLSVRVLSLPTLSTPVVMGVLSPVLVVPTAMLTGLSPDQQLAIVAHELAHIRRWDFFVNLCQLVIESLLFFNPAVWWMSRQVRIEREACCDAIAVTMTSTPIDYVQTLADWAERSRFDSVPGGGLVPAFAEPAEPGSLVDRVGRVLRPALAPRLRVRWFSLAGLLVAIGAVLFFASRGTDWAVAQVAKALTDQERIAVVEEAKRAIPDPVEEDYGADKEVKVIGRVVTEDGGELVRPSLNAQSRNKNSSYGGTGTVEKDGRFSMSVPRGMVGVAVFAQGYAPGIVAPQPVKGGETLDVGEVTLTRGRAATLQFVDLEGKPVRADRISASPASLTSHPAINETADERGELVLPHVLDMEYTIAARARGFQPIYQQKTILTKDGPTQIVMKPARPVTGIVRDEKGQPAAGVELHVPWENYGRTAAVPNRVADVSGSIDHNFPGPVWATTDADGRFVIDQMSDGSSVSIVPMKDGRVRGVWIDVPFHAGNLDWTLEPPITVKGKFTGDLTLLGKDERYRSVFYSVLRDRSLAGRQQVIATHTRIQPDGSFELTNLVKGRLQMSSTVYRFERDLTESIDGLEVPVRKPEETAKAEQRRIKLRFLHGETPVQPGGRLQVKTHDPDGGDYSDRAVEVTSSELEISAPKLGTLSISARGLIGFTFADTVDRSLYLKDVGETLDLSVVPAGAVAVKVMEQNGAPIPFARLSRSVRQGNRHSWGSTEIETNDHGDALMSPLVLDSKVVVIAAVDRAWTASEEVTLDAAHPQGEVRIGVPRRRIVRVRVLDENGQPAVDVPLGLEVSIRGNASVSHGFGVVARTDEAGTATITGVSSNLEGYHVLPPSLGPWVAERYELPSSGELEIRLTRGAVLEGTVLDSDGHPVKNIQVGASIDGKPGERSVFYYSAEEKTDAEGKFRFLNLPDAMFRLTAHGIDTAGVAPVVTPNEGPVEIRGRVADWVK
jgi:beta-lactamase regulating signal transducer with metallopeptidase domain